MILYIISFLSYILETIHGTSEPTIIYVLIYFADNKKCKEVILISSINCY